MCCLLAVRMSVSLCPFNFRLLFVVCLSVCCCSSCCCCFIKWRAPVERFLFGICYQKLINVYNKNATTSSFDPFMPVTSRCAILLYIKQNGRFAWRCDLGLQGLQCLNDFRKLNISSESMGTQKKKI